MHKRGRNLIWLDDLAAAFPHPRDDEPPELRARIVKELRDHLTCAYRRELVLCGNESEAERRVVEKFGDPRRIARKLWLDAMQEKIMSQRWNLALSSIMACACLASLAVVIVMTRDNRELNHLLLEQSRAANAALLAELSARREPPAAIPAASLEWNPVKLRLVQSRRGGAPVAGFKVGLMGNLLDSAKQMSLTRETGPDGVADFGLVRPGEHNLAISSPWGECLLESPFVVLPGKPIDRELPCPPPPDEPGSISCIVKMPPALRERNVWLLVEATRARANCDGTLWFHPAASARQYFLISPDGNLQKLPDHELGSSMIFEGFSLSFAGLTPGPVSQMEFGCSSLRDPFFQFSDIPGGGTGANVEEPRFFRETDDDANVEVWVQMSGSGKWKRRETPWSETGYRPFFLRVADTERQTELRLPPGRYRIENLIVCEPPRASARLDYLRYDMLGGLVCGVTEIGNFNERDDDEGKVNLGTLEAIVLRNWSDGLERPTDGSDAEKREQILAPLLQTFDVHSGRANQWEIAVPQRLTECVERFIADCQKVRQPIATSDDPATYPAAPPDRPARRRRFAPDSPDDESGLVPSLVPSPDDDEPRPKRIPDDSSR